MHALCLKHYSTVGGFPCKAYCLLYLGSYRCNLDCWQRLFQSISQDRRHSTLYTGSSKSQCIAGARDQRQHKISFPAKGKLRKRVRMKIQHAGVPNAASHPQDFRKLFFGPLAHSVCYFLKYDAMYPVSVQSRRRVFWRYYLLLPPSLSIRLGKNPLFAILDLRRPRAVPSSWC